MHLEVDLMLLSGKATLSSLKRALAMLNELSCRTSFHACFHGLPLQPFCICILLPLFSHQPTDRQSANQQIWPNRCISGYSCHGFWTHTHTQTDKVLTGMLTLSKFLPLQSCAASQASTYRQTKACSVTATHRQHNTTNAAGCMSQNTGSAWQAA